MTKPFKNPGHVDDLVEDLKAYSIEFDEDSYPMFKNHMDSLTQRAKELQLIQAPESDYAMILPELTQESLDLATSIVDQLVEPYELEESMMEIILVATHLQTNKK